MSPPLAGLLEDLQLSPRAPTNFLIEASFKTVAGQTDAVLIQKINGAGCALGLSSADVLTIDTRGAVQVTLVLMGSPGHLAQLPQLPAKRGCSGAGSRV